MLKGKEKLRDCSPLDIVSGVGLLLYLCAYPYFLKNRYFGMTLAKTFFFYGITAAFALACLITRRALKDRVSFKRERTPTDLFFAAFLALAVVSCAAGENPLSSLGGGDGRYMGLITFLFIGLAYLFVSRYGQFKTWVAVVFGVSLAAMTVISFLQFCRVDVFHLYEGTRKAVKIGFMSMLGNKDVYYSYLSLAVPFAMYLTFEAVSLREKIFWYAVDFFGFVGIVICNCSGGYICLLVSILFFLLVKCDDKVRLLVLLRILMLIFAAGLLVSLLKSNLKAGGIRQDVITRLFITPWLCGGLLVLFTGVYAVVLRKTLKPRFFVVLKKTVVIAALVGAAVLAAVFVYFSWINKTVKIGALSQLLRFDGNKWGSGRGYIWSRLVTIYHEFPFYRKLIGAGEESIAFLMDQRFPEEVESKTVVFDNAHNEYLQYLVTHGLLGLTAYLLFAVSAIRRGFREGGRCQRAAALGAVCYMAQAFFNITQGLTTPLFFVFLALTQTRDIALLPKERKDAAPVDASPEQTAETEGPEPPAEGPEADAVPLSGAEAVAGAEPDGLENDGREYDACREETE